MITADTVPQRSARTAARVVDGKALIVVIDEKRMHVLNGVGTRVWELCDGRSVGSIANSIVEEYSVDRSFVLDDVIKFVTSLSEIGALELGERR